MKNDKPEDLCLDQPVDVIWAQALELLARVVKESSFAAWVRPTQLIDITTGEATLAVANEFARARIASVHAGHIESVLKDILGRKIKLKIVVEPLFLTRCDYTPSIGAITVLPPSPTQPLEKPAPAFEMGVRSQNHNLNHKHIFATYVVGSSNRFSHAAALAVADKPGQAYNPLFLYGGVGLGKTHLLGAIGNAILEKAPDTVIRFLSCEKFTNEVINAIREQKTPEFRKRYRQIDLLLIDDIQFLEGKESTQEEFFHTFNHLREAGKQIVLTSDRPPKALARLTERLRSRFEGGLITDIQAPDYEMRLAILRQKAEKEAMQIQDFVFEYIAGTFINNIRELEGALLRANVYASFTGTALTPASIGEALQPGVRKKERPPLTAERLIDVVAAYYKVEPGDIRSSRRSQDLTVPRHIAMYLAHEIMSLSYPKIGSVFGGRKHTSALYAHKNVKIAISEDPAVAEVIREITRQLDV